MEGYPDRMLALQALAAENTQAAEELLRRMRAMQVSAAERTTEQKSDQIGRTAERRSDDEAFRLPEETAVADAAQALRRAETVRMETARAETARTQLLERLTALAEPWTTLAEPWTALNDVSREPASDAVEVWNQNGTQSALEQMRQRLTRAVQSVGASAAQTLPADGARDIAPGGTADAAALSRMFERDARRYDGCFEMPL